MSSPLQTVCTDSSASYLWEMALGEGTPPVRAQFSVEYRAVEAENRQRFKFEFTVADYRVSGDCLAAAP